MNRNRSVREVEEGDIRNRNVGNDDGFKWHDEVERCEVVEPTLVPRCDHGKTPSCQQKVPRAMDTNDIMAIDKPNEGHVDPSMRGNETTKKRIAEIVRV